MGGGEGGQACGRGSSYPNAAGAALLQAAELAAERRAAQLASSTRRTGGSSV